MSILQARSRHLSVRTPLAFVPELGSVTTEWGREPEKAIVGVNCLPDRSLNRAPYPTMSDLPTEMPRTLCISSDVAVVLAAGSVWAGSDWEFHVMAAEARTPAATVAEDEWGG